MEDVNDEIAQNENSPNLKYRERFQKAAQIMDRIRKRQIYKFVKEFHYFIQEGSNEEVVQLFKAEFQKDKIIRAISQ